MSDNCNHVDSATNIPDAGVIARVDADMCSSEGAGTDVLLHIGQIKADKQDDDQLICELPVGCRALLVMREIIREPESGPACPVEVSVFGDNAAAAIESVKRSSDGSIELDVRNVGNNVLCLEVGEAVARLAVEAACGSAHRTDSKTIVIEALGQRARSSEGGICKDSSQDSESSTAPGDESRNSEMRILTPIAVIGLLIAGVLDFTALFVAPAEGNALQLVVGFNIGIAILLIVLCFSVFKSDKFRIAGR